MNLQEAAALGGIIFGAAGLTLSIVVYLRDRAAVEIALLWGMTILQGRTERPAALVRIVNTGRRTIFVSHVRLTFPDQKGVALFKGTVEGRKLAEGDPPWGIPIEYTPENLEILARNKLKWWEVRAEVEDSTGKIWRSKKARRRDKPPSWSTE